MTYKKWDVTALMGEDDKECESVNMKVSGIEWEEGEDIVIAVLFYFVELEMKMAEDEKGGRRR